MSKKHTIYLNVLGFNTCPNEPTKEDVIERQNVLSKYPINVNTDHTHIPSFRYRDNSVRCHECSPFWVGISIICI